MDYKTIEQDGKVVGVAVNDNGLPVMVDDDGKEIGVDAIHLFGKIPSLQEEAKNHRLKAKEIQEEFDTFKERFSGIEDPAKALEALTKIKDIDGQKLIDANEAATLRQQLEEAHNKQVGSIKETYETKLTELTSVIDSQQKDLFDALVLQKFNSSSWFAGETPKTYLPPAVAKDHFGKYFKVEKDATGKSMVVGYHVGGSNDGQKIFSIERPGETAGFDEAISIIIDGHPQKASLLRASMGGGAGGADHLTSVSKLDKMRSELVEAQKSRDFATANKLIRLINQEENK